VSENVQTNKWEVLVHTIGESPYKSAVASDGTLRVLALLAALYDPTYRGLICFEEPENGIHPLRLRRLIEYLRQLVTDVQIPSIEEIELQPLTQITVSSHSPIVLNAVPRSDVVVFDTASLIDIELGAPGNSIPTMSRVTRRRRVASSDQMGFAGEDGEPLVSGSEVDRYLAEALLE
jgi:hypothetical protein